MSYKFNVGAAIFYDFFKYLCVVRLFELNAGKIIEPAEETQSFRRRLFFKSD